MAKTPERTVFDSLLTQVKVTNCLLAAQLRLHMNQTEIVDLLRHVGLSAREVADMLGTSPAVVSVTRSRIRQRQSTEEPRDGEAPEVSENDLREEGAGSE
jgi:DNA-directed RNA polymerase specialized sigma24 family protein